MQDIRKKGWDLALWYNYRHSEIIRRYADIVLVNGHFCNLSYGALRGQSGDFYQEFYCVVLCFLTCGLSICVL